MIEELITPITNTELEKLEKFIGYGKKDADIIFFGLEEGGGGSKNIRTRINTPDYEFLDCKRFHLDHLANNQKNYKLHSDNNESKVNLQQVWKFMSYIMLKLDDKNNNEIFTKNSKLLREYQNNLLGTKSIHGKSLLTEIYPIPCENIKKWGHKNENYLGLIPQYEKGKNQYRKTIIKKRVGLFKELIDSRDFKSKAIICYGKSHWNEFKSFFKEFDVEFEPTDFSKESLQGNLNERTKVYLLPFLGNGQVSYEFLEELTTKIKMI